VLCFKATIIFLGFISNKIKVTEGAATTVRSITESISDIIAKAYKLNTITKPKLYPINFRTLSF